jgi:hypothetical protein
MVTQKIANIIEKRDKEKNTKNSYLPMLNATRRAAVYTGISYFMIKKTDKNRKTLGKPPGITRKEEKYLSL